MVLPDRVMGLGWRNEITGNQFGALVYQLIKCVLSIGAGLSPDDGTGLVVDRRAVTVHVFAVALHVTLLEVGSEPVQVLVVGQDGVGFGVKKVVIPNAHQRHNNRYIVFKRCVAEMLVRSVCPLQQLFKVIESYAQYNG